MTSSGPKSRGDDAKATSSATCCPKFDPTYARLDLDGPTSLLLANETDEAVTSGTEVTSADVTTKLTGTDDPVRGVAPTGMIPLNNEDPELPYGNVFPSSSSSSSGLRASSDESDDEDMFVEVEQTRKAKKVKKKAKVKVRPDPLGPSLSDEKSLKRLRKKCGISEEIVLVAPTPTDRADAPPLDTLLSVHGVCVAQINPRGIKHLLGIYVLSRECGVVVSTEHLSYLTDFRVHGQSEELKHTVTNSSGWHSLPGSRARTTILRIVSSSLRFLRGLSRRIASTLSRRDGKEEATLEVAAKAKRSSGSSASRVVAPMTSSSMAMSVRARHLGPSVSKTLHPPPLSGERVDTFPAAVVGRETLANRVGGLLRDEAYSAVKSKASKDVRSRDDELGAAEEANAVLQLRLDEIVERNEVEGEVVQLRGELNSASDLKRSRIDDAVAEARDEMIRRFTERTSEVAGLLAEIGGKAQNDMLNLTEIDANLEFISLLQGSEPPNLLTEVKALRGRRHPIYDAHDLFADLLASVRRALEIHVVSAVVVEARFAVDDDIDVSDEGDVEMTYDDEDAED
ncbi:hypothetical protein AALP_AA7G146800 [Arabis alpina]|uniref:Uncharacterized protein n=1 Tax=Arabis alpina TaxID=50452 RepID=A0A087GI33_ARAAL|nr:hypothetical protein AALP_AA7G146800 [Arabis alpina]